MNTQYLMLDEPETSTQTPQLQPQAEAAPILTPPPSTLNPPTTDAAAPVPSTHPSIHQSINPSLPSPSFSQPPQLQPLAEADPTPDSQPSTLNPQPFFPLSPGETPRAFNAFMTFFHLGHGRTHQAVADHLAERCHTVRNWASRYHWTHRIQAFNSGLLEHQAQAEAAARRKQAADWSRRSAQYRELEWLAAQKLIAAAQCFLDNFGDREVEKMNLAQVSRALQIASRIARQALTAAAPEAPALAPFQVQFLEELKHAYSHPPESESLNPVPVDP